MLVASNVDVPRGRLCGVIVRRWTVEDVDMVRCAPRLDGSASRGAVLEHVVVTDVNPLGDKSVHRGCHVRHRWVVPASVAPAPGCSIHTRPGSAPRARSSNGVDQVMEVAPIIEQHHHNVWLLSVRRGRDMHLLQ